MWWRETHTNTYLQETRILFQQLATFLTPNLVEKLAMPFYKKFIGKNSSESLR